MPTNSTTFVNQVTPIVANWLNDINDYVFDEIVSVKRYGAVGDGVADDTGAFSAANAAGLHLAVPAGTYNLNNWQPLNGTVLHGAGYLATYLVQGANGSPAIFINNGNVNWQGLEFTGFTLNGSASPTVAAFQVTPGASGAIWRSTFKFCAKDTYQAFNVTSAGTNFFDNDVHIQSEGTVTTSVYIQSGTYNRFVLFLTECANSIAIDHGGINDTMTVVTDGQIKSSGLNTTFINPTVENLFGTSLSAGEAAISLSGTNQVLINPTVILPSGSAAKCTYAFKPSNATIFQNPYVTSNGTTLANPFSVNSAFKWTLIGGQSNCTNKMETIYDGTTNINSLRNVTMVGDVSQLTTGGNTHGGMVTQYLAPSSPFNLNIDPNTDVVVLVPSGAIASPQFNISIGLDDGRVITVTSTQNLTGTINWVSSADVTQLPATMTAGTPVSFVYRAAQNKFFKV